MNVWARMSNIVVREITTVDPAGRFTSDINWVQVLPVATFGGDPAAVTPRWTYENNIFYPPQAGIATVYLQSGAQFSNLVTITGNVFINSGTGEIDESCWQQLAVVNISASNSTAHFVSYSSHILDLALNVGNVTYINSPISSYDGRGEFVGGEISSPSKDTQQSEKSTPDTGFAAGAGLG